MFDEEKFEQQLRQARASLVQARAAVRDAPAPAEVTADAADGRIRVTVGTAGRVTEVAIDPRTLREGAEFLGEQLMAAVNAALDQQAAPAGEAEPMPDLASMAATVERLQDEGLRQMRQITTEVAATMRKLHAGQR